MQQNNDNPEQKRALENQLINSFIEDELPYWDVTGDPSVYNDLKPNHKHTVQLAAFQFLNNAYSEKQDENPKYKDVPFQNFVKIYRPEKELVNSGDMHSQLYKDVFGSDTGAFKDAALQGYKRILSERDA